MAEPETISANIDFLPAHYRERTSKRRTDLWRLLVVGMLGSVVAFSAVVAQQMYYQAHAEFATIESLQSGSDTTNAKLADLQAKLKPLRAAAELFTYLRHPWPKTQILSAVVQPLPDSITLTRLHIVRESTEKSTFGQMPARTAAAAPGAAGKDGASMSDLQRLRADYDSVKFVVLLAGSVSEPTDLYEYLGRLGDQGLFSRVELGPVERSANNQGPSRFTARLTVRAAYGQPGGPAPPLAAAGNPAVAQANRMGGTP